MRIVIILICLASLIPSFVLNQPDKFMHFVAGATIGAIPPPFGLLVAATAGISKEWYDMKHEGHTSSWNDIIMTIIGAIFVSAIVWIPYKRKA